MLNSRDQKNFGKDRNCPTILFYKIEFHKGNMTVCNKQTQRKYWLYWNSWKRKILFVSWVWLIGIFILMKVIILCLDLRSLRMARECSPSADIRLSSMGNRLIKTLGLSRLVTQWRTKSLICLGWSIVFTMIAWWMVRWVLMSQGDNQITLCVQFVLKNSKLISNLTQDRDLKPC